MPPANPALWDRRAAIAQVLYCMAVQDKTQPVPFLTPGIRRQLAARLDQYRTILAWMTSPQPLTADQAQQLIRRAEDCRMICPLVPPSARRRWRRAARPMTRARPTGRNGCS